MSKTKKQKEVKTENVKVNFFLPRNLYDKVIDIMHNDRLDNRTKAFLKVIRKGVKK